MVCRNWERISNCRGGVGVLLVFVLAMALGALAGALAGYVRSAPTLEEVRFSPKLTTYIYDANGEILTRLYKENRDPVALQDIPLYLRQAVIAIEDERFYTHHGVDLRSTARALVVNAKSGSVEQGGSTITQQLAKNAFLSHERTWTRKLRELLWTVQIERSYAKDEILEAYLNHIYFGHGAYGVEAAARTYFGKSVREVTLPEAAFLAGVTRGPGVYSPFIDANAAVNRRNVVLNKMHELGIISSQEAAAAKETLLSTVERKEQEKVGSYFTDYIVQQLLDLYGENRVYGGGLRVYTTLDLGAQRSAEKALLDGLPKLSQSKDGLQQPQGALISIEPETGFIRAMVGGRGTDKFNRAVQAYRQPGSAIKPILYAAALEQGYTSASVLLDEPINLDLGNGETWSPENYDKTYRGNISLREALEQSVNVVAVKVLEDIGPRTVLDYARRLGLTSLIDKGPRNDMNASLALGGLTQGVSPLELVTVYAAFANGGIYVAPVAITKITGPDGEVLFEYRPERRIVMSEALAYVMTDMLQGVIHHGTGRSAQIGRPAAGKTGTTSDYTNAWFVGYTSDLATAVWIGNDAQRDPMVAGDLSIGSSWAAGIWGNYMKAALEDKPPSEFQVPARGLRQNVSIDRRNGLLVSPSCQIPDEFVRKEIFLDKYVPVRVTPACL